MLAHPPSPNPTTSTHTTTNEFTMNIAVQLGRKKGGFSAEFCRTDRRHAITLANPVNWFVIRWRNRPWRNGDLEWLVYLSRGRCTVGEHVGCGGDDVDGEADEECADGRVDGAEEGEDDGEEPDGDDDGEAGESAEADAGGGVDPDDLLPHEVERRAGEAEGDELVDQHQDHRRVPPPRLRQQGERVGVRQQLVAERPVHRRRRRKRQREHIQRRQQVDVLELLGLPHRVHYLPAPIDVSRFEVKK
ncbi:hypothetical protein ZIOFF_029985 [Zingiber officinale]|uniref:Uncharacterized protein n=1 Tax=Zingiber officinale TaxID=94328 RepID=A0A8J5GXJ2_ZINOF|nr:hypothetical protein ZIOFF_029985 [Zingiber officinale]